MAAWQDWLVDSDNDGIPDDLSIRFVLDPSSGVFDGQTVAALMDLAATIGLHMVALPLPFFHGPDAVPDHESIRITSREQIHDLQPPSTDRGNSAASLPTDACLSKIFTIGGALADNDADLVADATRITFSLPESIPADLAASLANLAARIGLESGGINLPLCRADGNFRVEISSDAADLRSTTSGWIAQGEPTMLAGLLDRVAQDWPHFTIPEAGGVGYSLGWLRRALAGDGPEPREQGALRWEMQWSAQREADLIVEAFENNILPHLERDSPVRIVAFASEPQPVRRAIRKRIHRLLMSRGIDHADVLVIATFKAGLSWLQEAVIPNLAGESVERVRITYRPFQPGEASLDRPTRWLQELFPGNEIIARDLGFRLDQIEIVEGSPDGQTFTAEAFRGDGTLAGAWELSLLSRQWPFVDAVPDSGTVEVTTSGVVAEHAGGRIEASVRSDLEAFWAFWQKEVIPRVLDQIEQHGGAHQHLQPFFSRLEADVWVSEPNSRLGIREENDSSAEALHEDIYFNTLDAIEMYGERTTGDRTSAPGAVVPFVHVVAGCTPHARVRLFAPAATGQNLPHVDLSIDRLTLEDGDLVPHVRLNDHPVPATRQRLASLAADGGMVANSLRVRVQDGRNEFALRLPLQPVLSTNNSLTEPPPMNVNIHGDRVVELASLAAGLPGTVAWIEDYSYEGRPIPVIAVTSETHGRLRSPAKLSALRPTALIVARHHANEISSTNAAFRLAWLCATDPEWQDIRNRVNIIIIPYENPDGAALHAKLTADPAARYWKHHPARYNALGTEFSQEFFNPDTPFGESRVRPALWRRFLPDAIVDNHGVPSHEWVQPFAGFGSPPRFRVSYWIPQALLYGIIGYVESEDLPQHQTMAEALRDAVSSAVKDTDIGALNDEIGNSYRFWGQDRDPERFPGTFHNGMLWHIAGSPPGPEGRGFSSRYPNTTVLNWVTEVNDETAEGDHLKRTARAHLIANRAMLELLAASHQVPELSDADGSLLRVRSRPLDVREK